MAEIARSAKTACSISASSGLRPDTTIAGHVRITLLSSWPSIPS